MLERAYELASSGRFRGLDAIKTQLKSEGYNQAELRDNFHGFAIRQAIRKLCRQARENQ